MLQMVLSTEDDTGNIWWLFQLWGMKENVNVAGSYVWIVTRILPLDGHFKSLYDLMWFYYCVLSCSVSFPHILENSQIEGDISLGSSFTRHVQLTGGCHCGLRFVGGALPCSPSRWWGQAWNGMGHTLVIGEARQATNN